MKINKKLKGIIAIISIIAIITVSFSGCRFAWLSSKLNSIKGSLIGVSYTGEFFDNYGAKFLTVSGKKIDIDGNFVEELSVDSTGYESTTHSLSSVITITIDGKQIESCGDTIIFAEEGLKKDVDFSLSEAINSNSNNELSSLTSVAKVINQYKNMFGKGQVVVIQSQLGVPICAYSGDDVYWEIPNNLPKMTKLMIDGKALYIHRANFQIIDKALIK